SRGQDPRETYKEAARCFGLAVERSPRHWEAYYQRGYMYEHLLRYDEAMEEYKKAQAILAKPSRKLDGAVARVRAKLKKPK
ncbi:MAG: hypothetical protein ACYS47_17395, partial [Planctomycetota bacterium]